MYMTVRDALTEPALRELRLIAGATGLDRQVTRVSVLEVPGGHKLWSRGGELFMSTFYALRGNCDRQVEVLRTMAENNAAALCLHPGFEVQQFVEELAEAADRYGFPLLTMPQDMPYAVVTDAVVGGLQGRQAAIIQRSAAIHSELIQQILRGHDLDSICKVVSDRTRRPVAIVGPDGLEILSQGESLPEIDVCIDDLLHYRSRFNQQRNAISVPIQNVLNTGGPDHVLKISVATSFGTITQVAAPVLAASEIVAYLTTWELGTPLTEFDLSVLAHACTAAGLVVLRRRAVIEAERRIQQDFYGDAISGEFQSIERAAGRAEAAGISLADRYLVGLLPIDQPLSATETAELRHWPGSVSIPVGHAQALLLKVPSSEPRPVNRASELLENLSHNLRDVGSSRSVIGLSQVAFTVLELPLALNQARTAQETAEQLGMTDQVVGYDELGVYQLLGQVRNDPMLERFAGDVTGTLRAARGGKELAKTLEAYLDNQGSYRAAAVSLSVHPNTVKYRVARIRELLGGDVLEDPQRRLGLHLALKARRMLE